MNKEEKAQLKEDILKKVELEKAQIIELKELTKPIAPDCAIGRIPSKKVCLIVKSF